MLWRDLRARSAISALLFFSFLLGAAWAQMETVLYNFCSESGCADGKYPYGGVVFDPKGNIYGTTYDGGANTHEGVVFRLTPAGKETVLHSFNGADGWGPYAGVVFGPTGGLYGTATLGGSTDSGVIFELTPSGKYTVLYSFCAESSCPDGADPMAGLVFDQEHLFGTTAYGGSSSASAGVVFVLTK